MSIIRRRISCSSLSRIDYDKCHYPLSHVYWPLRSTFRWFHYCRLLSRIVNGASTRCSRHVQYAAFWYETRHRNWMPSQTVGFFPNILGYLFSFLPRDAMLARYMLSPRVRQSVCLSVTSRCSILKWLNIGSRRQRHTITQGLTLVFCCQRSARS